ncbi:hypothetical protein HKT18_12505 [Flavobacterium sp. IMCC34852]|uniref:Uncharacterized protein n=1 Tax=Flavobacterium rivulicola TaxID=2732161 RepID=A0A7Y3VZU3_9FLAO|nr:hypothetical protein [Flavobacterium sp. IMCC34852]NNT73038.1 hypothetical protein [Flavobacterium sp. IMCC34852]
MRILLVSILLFSTFAFSQQKIPNLTSITLYKTYNESDDGPCNAFKDEQFAQIMSRTIKDCDDLVMELINLKHSQKSSKRIGVPCSKGCIGCSDIENMIVYQYNKLIDTIYYINNDYEKIIIDSYQQNAYTDDESKLLDILFKSEEFKVFYQTDINKLFNQIYFNSKKDSIAVESIKIKNVPIYGLHREEVEKLIGGFDGIYTEEEKFNHWSKNIKCTLFGFNSGNEFYFNDNDPINCFSVEFLQMDEDEIKDLELYDVVGLFVGDDEIKFNEKFPSMDKILSVQKEYFKEKNGDYSITVMIANHKGRIDYVLNNSKIKQIVVNFRYPTN